MKIKIDTSGLKRSKWYEYATRFAFGGAVTAVAGLIAKRYGPVIGGLFMAFPAILPASATLIEKLETEKKERAGKDAGGRGRVAAGVDAIGASMGAFGLGAFALVVWKMLPSETGIVLAGATLVWLIVSVSAWEFREKLWRRWVQRLKAAERVRSSTSRTINH